MRCETLEAPAVWRGVLTIASTYVAFLLFAQFGFLAQLQHELADPRQVRAAMAVMGIGGLTASLGAAWLLGRVPGTRLIQAGLAAVALIAAASIVSHGFAGMLAIAAATGSSLGLLTVAIAASLPRLVPVRAMGRTAGLATGAAYFLSNLPVLFEADPKARALASAVLALVAWVFAPRGEREAQSASLLQERSKDSGSQGLLRLLLIFLVLIWLDSAAFAIVQASPELKARTWGTAEQELLQGGVHFLAALGAGALLDAGLGRALLLTAWGLFAVAFPLLQHGGAASPWAGPLYAAGISLYSTALVVMPARATSVPPRWRAGLLYGVAGWIGSALGVGMAQDQGRIPAWFLAATAPVLALAWIPRRALVNAARLYGPTLALGAAGAVGVWVEATAARLDTAESMRTGGRAALVARGREVYVSEGCIHCHSQYVRPGSRDVAWWGPSRPLDREERPPLPGVRRQGPDLLAVGNRRGEMWQEAHLRDPRRLNPGSRMPSYAYLFADGKERGRALVAYLQSLGADTTVERWALTLAEPITEPSTPSSAARGADLFGSYCAVCHGLQGRGDGPLAAALSDPYADLRKPGFHSLAGRPAAEPEVRALFRIVRHGLPPTSMPGHEWLTERQIADLVAYVKTLPQRDGGQRNP